jgi:DNA-binding transcriptional LysR family regulator
MTLQELRYFCVTAEVLHYTRASRLLYISQPSLSYALNKLEQELGVSLFKKDGKKVTPTKYGEEFLPYAKRALAELSEGTEHLREMKVPASGGINMGYIYSVSFSALPEFVNKFYMHQGNEQIAFRFRQGKAGELIELLISGSRDLLIAGKPELASIDYIPIYRQELFLIVPSTHRLADAESVTLSDIAGEYFISLNHETLTYHQLEKEFRKAEFEPNTIIEADEYSSIAASVSMGSGVAIMPILPILDSFNVKSIPFADSPMYRDICVLRSSSHEMSPEVQNVWELAKHISHESGNGVK